MAHDHLQPARALERSSLKAALVVILVFMAGEVVAGLLASSLALLADAAHMLADAGALGLSLAAATLASRPPRGAMTFGLGRAEILSAQANGITLLVLAGLIVYGGVSRLVSPPRVEGVVVLAVALTGVVVNLVAARILSGGARPRSLNVEGSYRHILTDFYGFALTAVAALLIITVKFWRADAIASLLVSMLMAKAAVELLSSSGRVFMEAAPAGLDPSLVGRTLAAQPGVVQVHDLHVWEVTSGFPALSAHVVVSAGEDCHELRRRLQALLEERFDLHHTTLQVDHDAAPQPPLQIEVPEREDSAPQPTAPSSSRQPLK